MKLSALNEVNPSEVHYVFNCLTYDYEFEQTLKIYFGVEKVKRFSDIEGFLNKKQRMELMKKRALMDSPKLYNNEHTTVGEFTYGLPDIVTYEGDETTLIIGRFCSIAKNVKIVCGGNHRVDWISTYPFNIFISEYAAIKGHPCSKGNITIGNDVWIGTGATILSGVTIGDGSVIAANATVTDDVAPYTVVGGVPAHFIKRRFDELTIKKLLEIKWWDWDYEKIYDAIPLLQSGHINELFKMM